MQIVLPVRACANNQRNNKHKNLINRAARRLTYDRKIWQPIPINTFPSYTHTHRPDHTLSHKNKINQTKNHKNKDDKYRAPKKRKLVKMTVKTSIIDLHIYTWFVACFVCCCAACFTTSAEIFIATTQIIKAHSTAVSILTQPGAFVSLVLLVYYLYIRIFVDHTVLYIYLSRSNQMCVNGLLDQQLGNFSCCLYLLCG